MESDTILELNEADKRFLGEIDAAFKGDSYQVLLDHNERLYKAAKNWCQNAAEYHDEAQMAKRDARRAYRGLLFGSVIGAVGWLLAIGLLIWRLKG